MEDKKQEGGLCNNDSKTKARKIKYDVIGLTETRRCHPLNAEHATEDELVKLACSSTQVWQRTSTSSNNLRPESDIC
ncbi:hypothetical protein NECAME_04142 [Necator americanus]|uniref:Uncharacterized protein n=1 Tax=Necator americanus TaxID=51031 RepID=W2SX59_NECAM|nr:hypothetical protein NECAME_04142 [Necator americanus]ETN74113.1 hypothetical protein NECAME_04142 [Necator americanus]